MKSGIFIISLDFELFWGMQDCISFQEYKGHIMGGRKAIPKLLSLFEEHQIHATWAIVGFMFAESFNELKKYIPQKSLRPSYDNKKLSTYRCFSRIGTDEDSAPCFYASSIIKHIADTPGQEIGSHTFSHYYCRESGQTIKQFEADVRSAIQIAKDHGYKVSSMVFPRNQTEKEYVDVISKLGFTAYRKEESDWIHRKIKNHTLLRALRLMDVYLPLTGQGGYHIVKENGNAVIPGSRMYKPYFRHFSFLEGMKVHRIKKQMLHAAVNGLTFHLWWHPHNIGERTEFHMDQIKEILEYYDYLNREYGMKSMNMREAAEQAT